MVDAHQAGVPATAVLSRWRKSLKWCDEIRAFAFLLIQAQDGFDNRVLGNTVVMSTNRRPARLGTYKETDLASLASSASYGGSAHHKTKPADYRFKPAVNPRPTKSLCDDKRAVPFDEAQQLLRQAFQLGMVSSDASPKENALPKYAWAADGNGEVYEAKLGDNGRRYHGYRLGHDDKFRKWVLKEWNKRPQRNS